MKLKKFLSFTIIMLAAIAGSAIFAACTGAICMLSVFDPNEGQFGTVEYLTEYSSGSDATICAVPAEGCEFVNFVNMAGVPVYSHVSTDPVEYTFKIKKDTSLKVNFRRKEFTVSIKFDDRPGLTLSVGAQFQQPFDPLTNAEVKRALVGYEFNGWKLADNTDYNEANYPYTHNITLTAQTTKKTYIVKYDNQGAVTPLGATFLIGGAITGLPESIANPPVGYEFAGWFNMNDAAASAQWKNAETITPDHIIKEGAKEADNYVIILAAKFTKIKYSIQFYNGGVPLVTRSNIEIDNVATRISLPSPAPVKQWHTLKGYTINGTSAVADNAVLSEANIVAANLTGGSKTIRVDAEWYENEYELTFVDGGSLYSINDNSAINLTYDNVNNKFDSTALAAREADRTGYNFVGWYVSGDTSKTVIGGTLAAASVAHVTGAPDDVSGGTAKYILALEPKWEAKLFIVALDITSEAGGISVTVPQSVIDNDYKIEIHYDEQLPQWMLYKTNNAQWDWTIATETYNTHSNIFKTDLGVSGSAGTMVLFITSVQPVEVREDSAGGALIFESSVNNRTGSAVLIENLPGYTAPGKTGYTFNNYQSTDGSAVTEVEYNTLLSEGTVIVIIAKFTPNPHSITYNSNGGSGMMSATATEYDATNVTLAENKFARTFYIFAGWSENDLATTAQYADKDELALITGDVVLYAVWQKAQYKLELVAEDTGEKLDEVVLYIDEIFSLPAAADIEFYNFDGYYANTIKLESGTADSAFLTSLGLDDNVKTASATAKYVSKVYVGYFNFDGSEHFTNTFGVGGTMTFNAISKPLFKFKGLNGAGTTYVSGNLINNDLLREAEPNTDGSGYYRIILEPIFEAIAYRIYFPNSIERPGGSNVYYGQISAADYAIEFEYHMTAHGSLAVELPLEAGYDFTAFIDYRTFEKFISSDFDTNMPLGFSLIRNDNVYVLEFDDVNFTFDDSITDIWFAPDWTYNVNISQVSFTSQNKIVASKAFDSFKYLEGGKKIGDYITGVDNGWTIWVWEHNEAAGTWEWINKGAAMSLYEVKPGDIILIGPIV